MSAIGDLLRKVTQGDTLTYQDTTPTKLLSYIPDRKVSVSDRDLDELKHIMFGEISNRNTNKQVLEARTIANVALNRLANGKGLSVGKGGTLSDVLTAPNQFQAFNGKEYGRSKSGQLTPSDAPKLKAIQSILAEIKSGSFTDSIEGRRYYTHDAAGAITATSKF